MMEIRRRLLSVSPRQKDIVKIQDKGYKLKCVCVSVGGTYNVQIFLICIKPVFMVYTQLALLIMELTTYSLAHDRNSHNAT